MFEKRRWWRGKYGYRDEKCNMETKIVIERRQMWCKEKECEEETNMLTERHTMFYWEKDSKWLINIVIKIQLK